MDNTSLPCSYLGELFHSHEKITSCIFGDRAWGFEDGFCLSGDVSICRKRFSQNKSQAMVLFNSFRLARKRTACIPFCQSTNPY